LKCFNGFIHGNQKNKWSTIWFEICKTGLETLKKQTIAKKEKLVGLNNNE
jgi:hypothetical protein